MSVFSSSQRVFPAYSRTTYLHAAPVARLRPTIVGVALFCGIYAAGSFAITPALVANYSGTTLITTNNTPNATDGTHFGSSTGGTSLTRSYRLEHAYIGLYGNTIATITAISSSNPDFAVNIGNCAGAGLWQGNPSCTYSVTYTPSGSSSIERTAIITYQWMQQSSATQSSMNVAGGVSWAAGCTNDVDGNGTVSTTTDGLILIRAMSGLTGVAVTQGAIGAGATRSVWMAATNPTPGNSIRLFLNALCGNTFAP
jgi:hypothetical protein